MKPATSVTAVIPTICWGGADLWGERNYPGTTHTGTGPGAFRGYLRAPSAGPNADPHLRSGNAVMGDHIHARDGQIGEMGYV
jgi:hypothetical protein